MYTPQDMVNYVFENEMEADFMVALATHKGEYSIGEITDAVFVNNSGECYLKSEAYNINISIEDDEIKTAIINGIYISPFVSRFKNAYQVHFLVHSFPKNMKSKFEEETLKEVLRYMILKTILALRLDAPLKIEQYAGRKNTK